MRSGYLQREMVCSYLKNFKEKTSDFEQSLPWLDSFLFLPNSWDKMGGFKWP